MHQTPDHPLLLLGQAVLTVLLFVHFFKVQHRSWPIRVAYGLLPFVVLANFLARIAGLAWFESSDISMFWVLSMTTGIKIVSFPALTSPKGPDVFDRLRLQIISGVIAVVVGLIGWGYVRERNQREQAEGEKNRAALQAATVTQEEYNCQQEAAKIERQAILSTVTSLSATQQSIVSGVSSISATQQSLIVGQKKATLIIASNAALLRTGPKPEVNTKPVTGEPAKTNQSPSDGTIKREVKSVPDKPQEKKGFFKKLFGSHSHTPDDSLHRAVVADSDTLVFY